MKETPKKKSIKQIQFKKGGKHIVTLLIGSIFILGFGIITSFAMDSTHENSQELKLDGFQLEDSNSERLFNNINNELTYIKANFNMVDGDDLDEVFDGFFKILEGMLNREDEWVKSNKSLIHYTIASNGSVLTVLSKYHINCILNFEKALSQEDEWIKNNRAMVCEKFIQCCLYEIIENENYEDAVKESEDDCEDYFITMPTDILRKKIIDLYNEAFAKNYFWVQGNINETDAYINIGDNYFYLKLDEGAIPNYKKALKFLLQQKRDIINEINKNKYASTNSEHLEKQQLIQNDIDKIYHNLCYIYSRSGNYKASIENAYLLLKSNPNSYYIDLEFLDCYGNALIKLQDYRQAIRFYKNELVQFKKIIESPSRIYCKIGDIFYMLKKHDLAKENYEAALNQQDEWIKYNREKVEHRLNECI